MDLNIQHKSIDELAIMKSQPTGEINVRNAILIAVASIVIIGGFVGYHIMFSKPVERILLPKDVQRDLDTAGDECRAAYMATKVQCRMEWENTWYDGGAVNYPKKANIRDIPVCDRTASVSLHACEQVRNGDSGYLQYLQHQESEERQHEIKVDADVKE